MRGQDECKRSVPHVQAEISNLGESLAVGRAFGWCGLAADATLDAGAYALKGDEDMSGSYGGRTLSLDGGRVTARSIVQHYLCHVIVQMRSKFPKEKSEGWDGEELLKDRFESRAFERSKRFEVRLWNGEELLCTQIIRNEA